VDLGLALAAAASCKYLSINLSGALYIHKEGGGGRGGDARSLYTYTRREGVGEEEG